MAASTGSARPCDRFNQLASLHGLSPAGFSKITEGILNRNTVLNWRKNPALQPRIDSAMAAWLVLDTLSRAQGASGYQFTDVWRPLDLLPPALLSLCLNIGEVHVRVKAFQNRAARKRA